jgi:hypothetical protein
MIAHTVRSGWQTILADLSLILFMVTASALANSSDGPLGNDGDAPVARVPAPPPRPAPIEQTPRAQPAAVWRPAPGAPSLPQWLGEVARDPRLRLTITVHYAPGGRDAALAQAIALGRSAGAPGKAARIVVEPGQPAGAGAVVGYDADPVSGTQLAGRGA